MPVQALDPDGWSAEPVDFDPFSFAEGSGGEDRNRDFGYPGENPANPAPLPGSPPRPPPPPNRGLGELFPVDPREVVGGLYGEATEGIGNLTAGAARRVGLWDPDLLGRDVTAMLDSPIHGASPGGGAHAVTAGLGDLSHYAPAILAGPLALTADRAKLAKAQSMLAAGTPLDEIYDTTKWFQNPNKQWQFEIPDTNARYAQDFTGTLGGSLYHPEAYAAYPGLKDTPLSYWSKAQQGANRGRWTPDRQGRGSVTTPPGRMELRQGLDSPSVPLHEMTHGVQTIEGFPPGGTPKAPYETNPNYPMWEQFKRTNLDKLVNDPPKNPAEWGAYMRFEDPTAAEFDFQEFQRAHAFSQRVGKPTPNLEHFASRKANYDYYLSHYGEAEARNVQERWARAKMMGGYGNIDRPYETMDTKYLSFPPYAEGGRVGFQDGGAPEDLLGSSVTYADDQPRIAGHVAASPTPDQVYTPKYLAARPQGSISSYDPSLSEKLQQGVSEAGQALGQPVEGAERMGSFARQTAEMAPVTGNILQGNEAMRAYHAGDPWGALLHGAMALPIPGASAEEGAARRLTPLGFYSHGADVAANLPQQVGTTEQMVAQLGKRGVKPAELAGAGLNDLSDMPPTTSKDELAWMLHRSLPPLQETVLKSSVEKPGWTEVPGGQRYGEYTLPGGQNYREVLMHLPPSGTPPSFEDWYARTHTSPLSRYSNDPYEMDQLTQKYEREKYNWPQTGNFTGSHWDQPNVVAHLRLNDRTGENGEKLLHMEELQSDWGQAVRDRGTAEDQDRLHQATADAERRYIVARQTGTLPEQAARFADYQEANTAFLQAANKGTAPPSGPYVTNTQHWTDLGLKRALIEAANGGYSHLSWTPGEDQAARWPTEKGASGLRGYYDRIVPTQLSKIVRKLDPNAQIGTSQIKGLDVENPNRFERGREVPSLEITPLMRERIKQGLPQYQRGGRVGFADGGWLSALWGNSPPPSLPRHPSSRGALLGLNYRAMPDMKAPIEDQRGNIPESLPPLWGQAAEDAEILSRYPPGSHVLNKDAWDWRQAHMPDELPTTPIEDQDARTGFRVGFADGGSLEPVDFDPFPPKPRVQQSDVARAKGFPEPRSPMHDRLLAASQDELAPGAEGRQIYVQPRGVSYTPEDIDQPGPMTETLAHYAGNPEHAMPMRIGAAIGEEGRRIGQGLWSAATAPGDVLTGKASMADPETQQRVMSLAASLPGGGPEAALGARGPVSAAARARMRTVAKDAPVETTTYEPPWAGEPAATTTEAPQPGPPAGGSNSRQLNRWNPQTGQWEGPKPKMNPPEGVTYPPLFNLDPAVMNKVPDVPQFELQRYNPPKGVSARMQDLVTNPAVRQQMLNIVRNGMQTVGLSWYNTGQLRAMFLKELGDTEGQQAFEKYMNLVSATSPENKIPQNIRTASHFYEREKQGLPPPERGDPIAQPYGSKAQKLHQQNVKSVLTEGYDVLKNPKPPSFVQNLMGNYAPGTMDRHAFKLPAMLSRDPRFLETSFKPEKGAEIVRPQQMFQNGDLTMDDAVNQPTMWAGMPNKNEYAALEGWYKSIGDELGITPAQVQASAWVGGGHITGLASAADETFLHSFQGRVFNTAHHTGQTPAEVVRRMIRGEQPLLAGGPGMAPLPPQGQARTEAQTSTAGAGASPPPPSDQELREHPFY